MLYSAEVFNTQVASAIPSELRELNQWVCWKYEDRNGKTTKPPYQAKSNGELPYARSDDPATWSAFDAAVAAAVRLNLAGVGLNLWSSDGLTGLDLDHVIDPATGELNPLAREVLERFAGTYTEISPSGTGIRIFCYGKPEHSGKCSGKVKWLEVYSHPSHRYLTVTGNPWPGSVLSVTNQQDALDWLHTRFMDKDKADSTGGEAAHGPSPVDSLDDAALLDKARHSQNGDAFDALWSGDTSAHNGDHSAADLALLNTLAFWTGKDSSRMDHLFRQSGLMREKWDESHTADGQTYGQISIDKAISDCRDSYSGKKPESKSRDDRRPAVNDADLAQRFQTDLGNSERLVARHGSDLRYCYDFGKWLVWDGVRWGIDRNGAALDRAKATARAMLAEAGTLMDKEDARKLAAWSFRSQGRDRMSAMLYLAQPDVAVCPEHLDTHPWLLNVANGTIDLQAGLLRSARRTDLLTKSSPVVYDASATCPQWLAFLDRIFEGKPEIINYVQKAAGYSLTGLDTEECFFVLHGVGQNGKSTFVETLSALLGTDYAQQATPDLLMQKKHERHATELAVLRGARLVASVETGQGKKLNEVLIKSMTGGDRIRANFMHQDTFEFRPEFKVWLSTNHKPVITGTDLGIWRRIRLIPFLVKIPDHERDGSFKTRLREPASLSGILNWALQGCLAWQREGLKPPQEIVDAIQEYREEMDVLAAWISDCCVVKKVAEAKAADLYASYTDWCDAQGERPEAQRSFGLRLTERGFEQKKRTGGNRYWLGIGLLSSADSGVSGASGVDSDIKKPISGGGFKNVESSATSATSATNITPFPSASPPVEAKTGIAPRPTKCQWDRWNDRLVVKCPNPSPNDDGSGCAHCGAVKANVAGVKS